MGKEGQYFHAATGMQKSDEEIVGRVGKSYCGANVGASHAGQSMV